LSYQREKNQEKPKQSKTKHNKRKQNTTRCPKFKCNTVSVSLSASRRSLVVVASKEERKKRVWRQFCECLSGAHLRTAVSLLLLEALLIADLRSEVSTHLAPQALFT
jgi:hypothetical protein